MKHIKLYLKSLLPLRWILLLAFILIFQFLLICFYKLGIDFDTFLLYSIVNTPYWIVVDILLGIGRRGILLKSI